MGAPHRLLQPTIRRSSAELRIVRWLAACIRPPFVTPVLVRPDQLTRSGGKRKLTGCMKKLPRASIWPKPVGGSKHWDKPRHSRAMFLSG